MRSPIEQGPTKAGAVLKHGCGVIYSGSAIEVLLDAVQIFGAVSLLEATTVTVTIARDNDVLYIWVALLYSFATISILHAIGAALEIFEGEYEKNWAILGLNWTVNFSGVLVFITCKIANGEPYLPWAEMVAPFIQTIVLFYALVKVGGWTGRIRLALVAIIAALFVVFAKAVYNFTQVQTLCSDLHIFKLTSSGDIVAHMPKDCVNFEEVIDSSYTVIEYGKKDTGEGIFINLKGSQESRMDVFLVLTNVFPFEYSMSDKLTTFTIVTVLSIFLLGGSFVFVIVAPRMKPIAGGKFFTAALVGGWIVAYPTYDLFFRVFPRLFDWAKSLVVNLKLGDYEFNFDGSITRSHESHKIGIHRFDSGRVDSLSKSLG